MNLALLTQQTCGLSWSRKSTRRLPKTFNSGDFMAPTGSPLSLSSRWILALPRAHPCRGGPVWNSGSSAPPPPQSIFNARRFLRSCNYPSGAFLCCWVLTAYARAYMPQTRIVLLYVQAEFFSFLSLWKVFPRKTYVSVVWSVYTVICVWWGAGEKFFCMWRIRGFERFY